VQKISSKLQGFHQKTPLCFLGKLMISAMPKISIVMPVYNLASEIAVNIARTAELFDSHGLRAELVPGQSYEIRVTVRRLEGRGLLGFYFLETGEMSLGMEYLD